MRRESARVGARLDALVKHDWRVVHFAVGYLANMSPDAVDAALDAWEKQKGVR